MAVYLVRRLILVIPTLFGIIAINFAIVQFAPEHIADLRGWIRTSSRTSRKCSASTSRH
jgi:microcin C transport system permease protein